MKLRLALVFQAFACLAISLPPPFDYVAEFDAVIIGGGPAGLAAASALGRVRRDVLLIDDGHYRNDPTRRVHDVLGFDGVTPAYLRFRARQQIMEYDTVRMQNGTVLGIATALPGEHESKSGFMVRFSFEQADGIWGHLAFGNVFTRKIVLATGIRDVIPSTPGLAENFGKGIYWCPWCDGHEHADQPMGILGPLDRSGDTPLEILTLNEDIIIFANGTDTDEARAKVEAKLPAFETWHKVHNITIDNRTITSVERLKDAGPSNEDPSRATLPEHDLFRVHFNEGDPVERATFITNWESEQRSDLGAKLGVRLQGGKLFADYSNGMKTNIPGVFAVGDANSDNSTNVPHAMWSGKRASVTLHVELEKEDARAEIAEALDNEELDKRDVGEWERSLWVDVNGPEDVLDGGDFDRYL